MSAATKEQMKQRRREIECETPSGFSVVIRPLSAEVHALSGGLPARLREMAMEGIEGIDKAIQSSDGDPELLTYLGGIVVGQLVSPKIEAPRFDFAEPKEGETKREVVLVAGDDPDEYLLPVDYKWLLLIAMGETDEDGTGKKLWGREPLSRFAPFLEEHGCAPDCDGCKRVGNRLSLEGAN